MSRRLDRRSVLVGAGSALAVGFFGRVAQVISGFRLPQNLME